jgi:hypothetical protein
VKKLQQLLTPAKKVVIDEDTAPLVRQSMATVLLTGLREKIQAAKDAAAAGNDEDPVVRHELIITIYGCKGLRNRDRERDGKSDPYCICWVPGRPKTEFSEFHTEAQRDALEPEWNHTGTLSDYVPGDSLRFTVRNKNFGLHRQDELLGEATLAGAEFWPGGFFDGELCLTHAGSGFGPILRVRVRTRGVRASEEEKRLERKEEPALAATTPARMPRARALTSYN